MGHRPRFHGWLGGFSSRVSLGPRDHEISSKVTPPKWLRLFLWSPVKATNDRYPRKKPSHPAPNYGPQVLLVRVSLGQPILGCYPTCNNCQRSSSREVRIRVPFFSVVYGSRGTLPQKRVGKGPNIHSLQVGSGNPQGLNKSYPDASEREGSRR